MDRRHFLRVSGSLVAMASACNAAPQPATQAVAVPADSTQEEKPPLPHPNSATTMPLLFVGHGTPLNALENTRWAQGWTSLGQSLPSPKSILAVSAHWFVPKTATTGQARPRTIHDFYGFPDELYRIEYPAPGQPELARVVAELLGPSASLALDWGLDHGTWSVLRRLYPNADIPVVQLSIHTDLSPAQHIELGKKLERLRHEGILILASGNITHNLPFVMQAMRNGDLTQMPWADSFDADVANALEQADLNWLAKALSSDNGRMSHPTPDHYLPLLYTAGAALATDSVSFPLSGMDMGTLSMRTVLWNS